MSWVFHTGLVFCLAISSSQTLEWNYPSDKVQKSLSSQLMALPIVSTKCTDSEITLQYFTEWSEKKHSGQKTQYSGYGKNFFESLNILFFLFSKWELECTWEIKVVVRGCCTISWYLSFHACLCRKSGYPWKSFIKTVCLLCFN